MWQVKRAMSIDTPKRLRQLGLVLGCLLLLTASCRIDTGGAGGAGEAADAKAGDSPDKEFAWVVIEGDVKQEGRVKINRAFRVRSILDGCGGWGRKSEFSVAPRSLTLKRLESGITNAWKIRFDEMETSKWKNFRFQDGDYIFVHTLYF